MENQFIREIPVAVLPLRCEFSLNWFVCYGVIPLHGQSTMAAQITELKAVEHLSPLPVFTVLCWERKDNSWEKDENKWSPYTPPTYFSHPLKVPRLQEEMLWGLTCFQDAKYCEWAWCYMDEERVPDIWSLSYRRVWVASSGTELRSLGKAASALS